MTRRRSSFAHARARTRHTTLGATFGTVCLLLTACTGSSSPSAKTHTDAAPAATASATATPPPSAADAATAKVLEAYQGFWKIQEEAYSSGSLDGLPVNTYALGQAFYDIKATLAYYNSSNLVMRGKPVLSPKVTAINVTKQPFTATVTDCIDTSNFLPVDKTTGKPAKLTDNVFRHPWTFTAAYDNVQWRIMTGKLDRSRTC